LKIWEKRDGGFRNMETRRFLPGENKGKRYDAPARKTKEPMTEINSAGKKSQRNGKVFLSPVPASKGRYQ